METYDGIISSDYSYMGWEYAGSILKEKTTKQLEKYVVSDNFTIILSAKFYQYDRNEKTLENEKKKNEDETYIFYDNPFLDDNKEKNIEDEENETILEDKKENEIKTDYDEKGEKEDEEENNEKEDDEDELIDGLSADNNEGGNDSGGKTNLENGDNETLSNINKAFEIIKNVLSDILVNFIYTLKSILINIFNGLKNAIINIYNYILSLLFTVLVLYKNNQLAKFIFIGTLKFLILLVLIYIFIIILKICNNRIKNQ